MGSTGYELLAGSRIVLAITSSDAPRILPHTNRFERGMGRHRFPPGPAATVRILHGDRSALDMMVATGA